MEKEACFSENTATVESRAVLVVGILPLDLTTSRILLLDTQLSTVPLELVFPNCTEQCPILVTSVKLVFNKGAFLSPKHRHPHAGKGPHAKRHIST